MKRTTPVLAITATLALLAGCASGRAAGKAGGGAADPASRAAFARLLSLAGDWEGEVGRVNFRMVSGGKTVMEDMFPGTPHNMISMYHLDGGALVCSHFCAMGNQPRMKLNPAISGPDELVFEFDGGSNLDPARDVHVHEGRIRLTAPDRLDAEWHVFRQGRCMGTNAFALKRIARS